MKVSIRPRVAGRSVTSDALAAAAALALVTVGTALPLVMMVNGSMALGIEYYGWTWWALGLVWFAAAAGALVMGAGHASGAVVLAIAAAAGVWTFRAEGGLLTFGLPWLIAAWSYFRVLSRGVQSAAHSVRVAEGDGVLKVQLRDATHEVLDQALEGPPDRVLVLPHEEDSTFPLLRSVDLFGDTYFATLQMPALRAELVRLRGMRLSDAQLGLLTEVDALAERCESEVHLFLVFAGD